MHQAPVIGGYPAFQESLNGFNTEADANIQGTHDRTEEIFRQEKARLAQEAQRYETAQRLERAAFQQQQAAQEAYRRASGQTFDAKVDAYHGELQKLDERHNKEMADRRAKFQAEMQEKERALDARIQAHRAAFAAQSHQNAPVPAIPYEAPSFSPGPYDQSAWSGNGLAPLPSLSGGGFQQPPAAAQPAQPPAQGGLAPLPALAPLPPLGGGPVPPPPGPADGGEQCPADGGEQCIVM